MDQTSNVLKNPLNKPEHWLKTPSSEDIQVLSEKMEIYVKTSKEIRKRLLNDWLTDVEDELKKPIGPVEKLSFLRKTRENIWPCGRCTKLSNQNFVSYFFLDTISILLSLNLVILPSIPTDNVDQIMNDS